MVPYDRLISIEKFEHVRNYQSLLQRIRGWLDQDGLLFAHIFCHHRLMYVFETNDNEGDQGNWVSRYFFTGGLMPALDTLLHFQNDLQIKAFWTVGGQHYEQTANAWLDNLDKNKAEVARLCEQVYGTEEGQHWRMFFMACAELFGYRNGREWLVGGYLFKVR